MNLLDLDARWRRLNDENRACPCCGRTFGGVIDLGFGHPDDWPHAPFEGTDVVVGDDRLGADLCRFEGRHFLRTVLPVPIRGSDETVSFGPWAEVSEDLFRAYLASFDDAETSFPGGEGLLANTLPLFEDDLGAAVELGDTDASHCPAMNVPDGDLARAQQEGISFDQLLDIYDIAGLDVRAHLMRD